MIKINYNNLNIMCYICVNLLRYMVLYTFLIQHFHRFFVKLPFSKDPKARQLQRALEAKDTLIASRDREIVTLRRRLKQEQTKSVASTPEISSPEKIVVDLLQDMHVTPNPDRCDLLLPYAVATDHIKKSSSRVKKALVFQRRCPKVKAKDVAHAIKLSRKLVYKQHQKINRRASVARAIKLQIVSFLKQPDNSIELPSKRDNVRGRGNFGLVDTMENLYQKFDIKVPNIRVSRSTFFSARPSWIKLVAYTRRSQCMCQKHANVALKTKAAHVLPHSASALCAMLDIDIRRKLETMAAESIKYNNWRSQEIKLDDRTIKKVKMCAVEEERNVFIDHFIADMEDFRSHCRRVHVQYEQTKALMHRLAPETEATIQIDYAENWAVKYQNEITAVYFDKNQITVHPMVVNYKKAGTECDKILHRSFVGVSSVTAHSVPTTFAFIKALMVQLVEMLPQLSTVHFISDSPSSQYRNRSMCMMVSMFPSLFNGIMASWSWLESGHGKGPCDGVGGAIKKKADNLVKSGSLITTSREFCKTIREASPNMTILEVLDDEVKQNKALITSWKTPAVYGIGSAHTIVPAGGLLMMRETSCFGVCCFGHGGVFRPTCDGWKKTGLSVLYQEVVTEVVAGPVEESMPTCIKVNSGTVAGPVEESLPTCIKVNSWLGVRFGKAWYVAKVMEVNEDETYQVAYMSRGKGTSWRWGRTETGQVEESDILQVMDEPTLEGKLYSFSEHDISSAKDNLLKD